MNHATTFDTMSRLFSLFLIGCCAAFGTGCLGPKHDKMKASLPPLDQEQGRIFFYRGKDSALNKGFMLGSWDPVIWLNGQKVGRAEEDGFFYVDRPPGSYEVEAHTEVKRHLTLTLDKAQTCFVRLKARLGFSMQHISPEFVDNETGEKEIAKCHYWDWTGIQ